MKLLSNSVSGAAMTLSGRFIRTMSRAKTVLTGGSLVISSTLMGSRRVAAAGGDG